MQRVVELGGEKVFSNWLSVTLPKEMSFDLNKREFRDAIILRYDWPIPDTQSVCVCGVRFTVDQAMIFKRGGFIIQKQGSMSCETLRRSC